MFDGHTHRCTSTESRNALAIACGAFLRPSSFATLSESLHPPDSVVQDCSPRIIGQPRAHLSQSLSDLRHALCCSTIHHRRTVTLEGLVVERLREHVGRHLLGRDELELDLATLLQLATLNATCVVVFSPMQLAFNVTPLSHPDPIEWDQGFRSLPDAS